MSAAHSLISLPQGFSTPSEPNRRRSDKEAGVMHPVTYFLSNQQDEERVVNSTDMGKLILRLTLGVLLLLHGISKLKHGVGFIGPSLTAHGLPAEISYLAYVGEVLAPIMLIVGFWTRPAALIVVVNMIFAIFLMHMSQLGELSKSGGWALELQAFYLFSALSVALLGAGRFSVGSRFN